MCRVSRGSFRFWCRWLSYLFPSLWQNKWQEQLKGGWGDLGSWWQKGEATCHLVSAVSKQRDKHWCPASFSFFLSSQSRTPGPWVVPATFKVHLPSSFELLWKCPLDTPRSVCPTWLYIVKLTMERDNHGKWELSVPLDIAHCSLVCFLSSNAVVFM